MRRMLIENPGRNRAINAFAAELLRQINGDATHLSKEILYAATQAKKRFILLLNSSIQNLLKNRGNLLFSCRLLMILLLLCLLML